MSLVFSKSLMSSIVSIPSSPYLNSTILNMSFKNGHSSLVLNYGLLPSDTNTKNLLLDIDNIFIDTVECKNLETKVMELNNETFNIFNWALHKNELQN